MQKDSDRSSVWSERIPIGWVDQNTLAKDSLFWRFSLDSRHVSL